MPGKPPLRPSTGPLLGVECGACWLPDVEHCTTRHLLVCGRQSGNLRLVSDVVFNVFKACLCKYDRMSKSLLTNTYILDSRHQRILAPIWLPLRIPEPNPDPQTETDPTPRSTATQHLDVNRRPLSTTATHGDLSVPAPQPATPSVYFLLRCTRPKVVCWK